MHHLPRSDPRIERESELFPLNEDNMKTILFILVSAAVMAQPPVAPTTGEPVGNPRGDSTGEYNISNSFELGYRFSSVGGDDGMYRATINYTDGLRLLSSSLFIQSKDGHGTWFDQLTLNTQGLGGDPYESANLRIEKNGLYRYDMVWRQNAFFDPAATVALGEHLENTTRTMQDHDLTLFPQSNYKFFLGYSRNTDNGPALSTVQLFDSAGNEFPIFANIRDQQNEYRAGADLTFLGWRLNVVHGWVDFKEDTPDNILGAEPGNVLGNLTTLDSFTRNQPYHGTSPYWRAGLFRQGKKLWAVNGRFSYVANHRGFDENELATGTNAFGNLQTQQILSFGDASRPELASNLNISLFPTTYLTLANQTTYNDNRTSGDAVFDQFLIGGPAQPVVPYQFLGIRDIANSTGAEIRVNKRFAIHTGYQYSDRRIDVISEQVNLGLSLPAIATQYEQVNILQEGSLGFRFRPIDPLTITIDGELGRNNQPYTPISDKDYQAFHGRALYKRKSFHAGVNARSDYNNNSITLTSFASRTRSYGADFSWTPKEWFAIDASYSKLHLNTMGGIFFFYNDVPTSAESIFISNIHAANLGARFALSKRVDFYVGYTHTQDVGDGRSNALETPFTTLAPFASAETFPLRFLSPQARLSVRLSRQIRWNVGYQYYGYSEQFSSLQDFRANTGYSSVLWSF
jgi:hypothetical protein